MKIFLTVAAVFFAGFAAAEEKRCLALNIYFEARGEPQEGQMAVAHVTLNRVQSRRFPNSICEVVYQPYQFSWTHIKRSHIPYNRAAWNRAKYIAEVAIDWHKVGEDFSQGALFYHADYVRPYWADRFDETVRIGKHIFYQ
jgi:spore germination cell wall hydrolase CwlJ-like protein